MIELLCHCGSQKNYAVCCQPFLTGKAHAQTPEELMRSRYSAFYEGNADYLIRTRHASKRDQDDRNRIEQMMQETEWLGLRVVNHSADVASGVVEFVAFYRERNFSSLSNFSPLPDFKDERRVVLPHQLHERSNFVRENGRWFYVDGVTLPDITIARNDPCWCGSGRKFKQCHGKK